MAISWFGGLITRKAADDRSDQCMVLRFAQEMALKWSLQGFLRPVSIFIAQSVGKMWIKSLQKAHFARRGDGDTA